MKDSWATFGWMAVIATRVSVWLWRDWRRARGLLVWLAFSLSLLFYLSDWPKARHSPADSDKIEVTPHASDDQIFTGSIITMPPDKQRCFELIFDNHTGRMSKRGYFNCDDVISELVREKVNTKNPLNPFQIISKGFRGDRD